MVERELSDHEMLAAEILCDRREKTGKFRQVEILRCGVCTARGGREAGELLSLHIAPEGTPVLLLPAHFGPTNQVGKLTGQLPNDDSDADGSQASERPVRGSKIPANCLVLNQAPIGFGRLVHCRRCLQSYLAMIEWDGKSVSLELHPTDPGIFARVAD